MGLEINLLKNYPRLKRDIKSRGEKKTAKDRIIARKFGKEFFDGNRKNGYGGFCYNEKYWKSVIPDFQKYYKLNKDSNILDVGCAKGFMLHDFKKIIPDIKVKGIDISKYAINNCIESVKNDLIVADALNLPFDDNSFDLVISITTVHNFKLEDCKKAIKEIMRVSKKYSFITVDAYRNENEKRAMHAWNLTAKTILHVDEWKFLFKSIGYQGDYYWFMP
jgi:ubiquinone/menaquinone biosynthesis C-methylase UbiE